MTDRSRHEVCNVEDLPPSTRTILNIGGRSIGIFNVDGELYALRNMCPHRSAPLCVGSLTGTMLPSDPGEFDYGLDGLILRCPWHGWEFDIRTGNALVDPDRWHVKSYKLTTHDGKIILHTA